MRARWLAVVALVVAPGTSGLDDRVLLDVEVPGEVVGEVVRRGAGDTVELDVLVDIEGAERLFSASTAEPAPRAVAELEPSEERAQLAVLDLDGDGLDELLVSTDHGVAVLRGGALARVVERSLPLDGALAVESGAGRALAVPQVGRLLLLRGVGAELVVESGLALPIAVERRSASLALSTPPLRSLHRRSGGTLLVGGPEEGGGGRLRIDLVELTGAADGGPGERSERWLRLPGPEAVEASRIAWLEGELVVLVTTLPNDRIGVFAEQTLHLYRPRDDRRRLGSLPFFTVVTEAKRWQRADPHLVDVSGDGREDLVVVHPKGLGGESLLVDTYLREPRRFVRSAKRLKLAVGDARWQFGDDLTGDGRPDLIAESGAELLVFPGIELRRGRPLGEEPVARVALDVASTPGAATVSIGSGGGERGSAADDGEEDRRMEHRWELVDLDGDSSRELLLVSSSPQRSRLRLLRLAG